MMKFYCLTQIAVEMLTAKRNSVTSDNCFDFVYEYLDQLRNELSAKVDLHASIIWVETLPLLYNLANYDPKQALHTIQHNLNRVAKIDEAETKVKKTYLSQLNINLKMLQVECLVASAEENPENIEQSVTILQNLNASMIKAFGNNKVPIIEIFIKPILLYTNLCQMLG